MPKRPLKPCAYPNCPNLVKPNERYCKEHKKQKDKKYKDKQYNKTKRDKEVYKIYNSRRWRKLRELALKRDNGLCAMCLQQGIISKAEIVDHIVEIKDGGEPYALDNLQSLCRACHNRKTADERAKREGAV